MPDTLGKTAKIARLEGGEDYHLFQDIEALHRVQLTAGALAHMPSGFLASFYRYLATRTDCVILTAEREGYLAGFVAGTLHASGLLTSFLTAQPLTTLGYCSRLVLRPRLLVRIIFLARYLVTGSRQSKMDERQLLSIAVDPGAIRSGVGTNLFVALCGWFRSRRVADFGIIAAKTQTAALHFYSRCGAVQVGETTLGGLSSIQFRCVVPSDVSANLDLGQRKDELSAPGPEGTLPR
jgi:ribosomal protein S18 acetylase RimI-like enzyme